MAGLVIQNLSESVSTLVGLDKQQEIGIGSFTMYAMIRRQKTLKSSIPKTPVEDGSDRSDHIILEPRQIVVEGLVADIFERRNEIVEAYQRAQSEIGNVAQYLPSRTLAQLSKINSVLNTSADVLRKVDKAVSDGKQAFRYFGNKSETTLREKFETEMDYLHFSKSLISIETPFQILENMRITSCVITDDNQAEELSFTITAEEFRFAKVIFDQENKFFNNPSSGNKGSIDGTKDKGQQSGEDVPVSALSSILGR